LLLFIIFGFCAIFFVRFVFLTLFFLLTSKFGNDVYAVSEDMFEDLCVIFQNNWQFYVGKVNICNYDVIKRYYIYWHQSVREKGRFAALFLLVSCIICWRRNWSNEWHIIMVMLTYRVYYIISNSEIFLLMFLFYFFAYSLLCCNVQTSFVFMLI
jgi:hypothetical protein